MTEDQIAQQELSPADVERLRAEQDSLQVQREAMDEELQFIRDTIHTAEVKLQPLLNEVLVVV